MIVMNFSEKHDLGLKAGRWRNTLVAIKMVEHTAAITPGLGVSSKSAPDSLQLETLLSLSLCHPNIVATFKVCTVLSGTLGRYGSGRGEASGSPEVFAPVDQRAVLLGPALSGAAEQPQHGTAAQSRRSKTVVSPAAGGPGSSAPDGAVSAAVAMTPSVMAEGISAVTSKLAPVTEEPPQLTVLGPLPTADCSSAAAAAVNERMQTGRAALEPPPMPIQATGQIAACSVPGPLAHRATREISLPRRLNWGSTKDNKPGTEQSAEQSAETLTSSAAEKSGGSVQDAPMMALSTQNGLQAVCTDQNGRNSKTQSGKLRCTASARCCPCVGSPATLESATSAAGQPDKVHVSAKVTHKPANGVDEAWDCAGEVR